jgi:hypothetical protein
MVGKTKFDGEKFDLDWIKLDSAQKKDIIEDLCKIANLRSANTFRDKSAKQGVLHFLEKKKAEIGYVPAFTSTAQLSN